MGAKGRVARAALAGSLFVAVGLAALAGHAGASTSDAARALAGEPVLGPILDIAAPLDPALDPLVNPLGPTLDGAKARQQGAAAAVNGTLAPLARPAQLAAGLVGAYTDAPLATAAGLLAASSYGYELSGLAPSRVFASVTAPGLETGVHRQVEWDQATVQVLFVTVTTPPDVVVPVDADAALAPQHVGAFDVQLLPPRVRALELLGIRLV